MSAQLDFYRVRMAEARAGAQSATLHNIRERWLLSEASWTELADRCERTERLQQTRTVEKADERAALALQSGP